MPDHKSIRKTQFTLEDNVRKRDLPYIFGTLLTVSVEIILIDIAV